METFYRFALSQPVTTAVIGCDSLEQLRQNVEFAKTFSPLTDKEMQALVDAVSPFACDLMYYKPSK
jgi:aryl-alcohol dehydrogenase-like predicted oxidoreductase